MNVAKASIEFKLDGPVGNPERELAECPIVVFPSGVLLFEKVIAKGFDGLG